MRHRIHGLVAAAIIALSAVPVRAASPEASLGGVANDPRSSIEFGRRLTAAADTSDPASALSAMLRAVGLRVTPEPIAAPEVLTGAAPTVADAVGRIAAAADTAERLRSRALARLSPAELQLARTGLRVALPTRASGARSGKVAEPSASAWTMHPRAGDIAARVDVDALHAAALTIVAATSSASNALRAAGDTSGEEAPSACGVSGDVVYETSDCTVIVGGAGANGYGPAVDPTVLVDLGGDDVYTNGAARAEGSVRVLVDVAGADTYTETASATAPTGGPLVVGGQGGGFAGVGILVDLGGADSYTASAAATAPQPGQVARATQTFAQGVGVLGAGVLVDVGGQNRFTLSGSSSGGSALTVGQGAGAIGLGALLALSSPTDGGDDVYASTATSTMHLAEKTPAFERYLIGSAESDVQGSSALAGVGIAVDAVGDDVYTSTADGAVAQTIAQGGAQAGAALLVDAAGSDVMRAEALGDTSLSFVTTDPSVCWNVEVLVTVGDSNAIAQGAALVGAGALIDGAGNDSRRVDALSRAAAIAEARSDLNCSPFGSNRAVATARSGNGDAQGQGSAEAGAAALIDLEGNDANTLDTRSEVVARAIAVSPGPDTETPTATRGDGRSLGQGHATIGFGLIADALGDDRYASSATTYVETLSSTLGSAMLTPGIHRVHGWGSFGQAWLLDLNGTDEYPTQPEPASAGTNNACWSNSSEGRGRDITLLGGVPSGCV